MSFKKPGLPGGGGGGSPTVVYGRVVDVITDAFHPYYENYGESNALNGVFYVPLGSGDSETEEDNRYLFAYQSGNALKTAPLRGEIIEIIKDE